MLLLKIGVLILNKTYISASILSAFGVLFTLGEFIFLTMYIFKKIIVLSELL